MVDELDNEIFTCMYCKKECSVMEGTWPQDFTDGTPNINADDNDRNRNEFVCYDCLT